MKDNIRIGSGAGQELSVVERANDGLNARKLDDLLCLLLRTGENGDVVLRILGNDLKNRSTYETWEVLVSTLSTRE